MRYKLKSLLSSKTSKLSVKDYLISHRVASLKSDCLGAFEKINDCKFELEERRMFSLFFCWLGKYYLQKVCNNIVLAKQYNIKLSSTIRHRCLNILHGKPINKLIQHFFHNCSFNLSV